jgi:hypothetical protein
MGGSEADMPAYSVGDTGRRGGAGRRLRADSDGAWPPCLTIGNKADLVPQVLRRASLARDAIKIKVCPRHDESLHERRCARARAARRCRGQHGVAGAFLASGRAGGCWLGVWLL